MGVSERTIRRDVLALTADRPLETQQGNGGCVKVADNYHPHRNTFSEEQQQLLIKLLATSGERDARTLREMISEYGTAKYRKLLESEAG